MIGINVTTFAKMSNPLCNGVTSSNFSSGDGSSGNPYLICNNLQFARLSNEAPLLNNAYKLGADLSFLGSSFQIIGSNVTPFQGNMNGDGYTLSNITISIPLGRINYIAPFGYLKNASISNLNISGLKINAANNTQHIGGVAGYAENATISNVRVSDLAMNASTRSGGIIGYAINCTIQNCSANGSMVMHAYTYGSGGLVGRGDNSRISSSYSNARISVNNNSYYYGNKVGGLFGYLLNTQVSDVYSQGSIDFSNVGRSDGSFGVAGIVGVVSGGSVANAYFAGTMINIQGTSVGGAIGGLTGTSTNNVIWNQISSGQTTSAAGTASTTCAMINKNFWLNLGLSPTIWALMDGKYPKLAWQS